MSSAEDKKAIFIEGTKQAFCPHCKDTPKILDFTRRQAQICQNCLSLVNPPVRIRKCPTCGIEFKSSLNTYCNCCCPKYREDTFSELLMERPW